MKVYQITFCDKFGNCCIENPNLLEHIKSVFDLVSTGEIDFTVKIINYKEKDPSK